MSFDTMSERQRQVATCALQFCKSRYGATGLKIEEGISSSIGWRPTFYLKPTKLRMVAVEVEDHLYPEVLKGAAHDLSHYDFPVSVYQACSLEAYQTDPKQERVANLRRHGFGIITVDEAGGVVIQHHCVPLMQFISQEVFDKEIAGLPSKIKVALKDAYDTYNMNEGQGLQQAGQLVEGMIVSIAVSAARAGVIAAPGGAALADVIDRLYATNAFQTHRAALGGAREFVKDFRNIASHAPKSAAQVALKIRKCRIGFLDALTQVQKLQVVAKQVGYKIKLNL